MEAAKSSETFLTYNIATRGHNTEDPDLRASSILSLNKIFVVQKLVSYKISYKP
jgi:hypothetical protein